MSEEPATYEGIPVGPRDVVAAFADGEPVSPEALDDALSDADGRQFLIDILVLRGMVSGSDATPAQAAPSVAASIARSGLRQWIAAAAIAGVCVLGGYAAGQWRPAGEFLDDSSAGATAGQHLGSVAGPGVAGLAAPDPTTVIRLEPGVDWQEQAGGN